MNLQQITATFTTLSLPEMEQLATELKAAALTAHGANMPWIIWSREDFNPQNFTAQEVDEDTAEKVMDEAWADALHSHVFMELDDTDWEPVRQVTLDALKTVTTHD